MDLPVELKSLLNEHPERIKKKNDKKIAEELNYDGIPVE